MQAFSLFILLFMLFCFLIWGFYVENALSGLKSMVTTKVRLTTPHGMVPLWAQGRPVPTPSTCTHLALP